MSEYMDTKNCKALKGCLLIHGFGGNTSEIQPLANFLLNHGYKVECTSLKGHTGKRNDLKKCSYKDWIISAKVGYDRLQTECSSIYIVGFSMGGLIALQLALNNRVEGVITLNMPIYYWDFKRVALNIVEDIKIWKFSNLCRYFSSFCRLPIRALLNFRLLLSETKPVLKSIKCPIFSAQALQDDTVHKKSADYIYRNIGSEYKKLKFYDGSGHLILWSKAADSVINDVAEFLEEIGTSNSVKDGYNAVDM